MKRIFVILGPTASGKTAYAIALAQKYHGAVVSADSRQLYTHMNIGTAKPKEAWKTKPHAIDTPDMVAGIPHYLLNITTPDMPYTLSDWLTSARIVLPIIEQQGQTPIITGGTMLYIDALIDGYDIPHTKPNLTLRSKLEQQSPEVLYKQLTNKDPEAAHFIEPHNTRRMIRALEVMDATGKPFSESRKKKPTDMLFHIIGIFDDYDTLRKRVTERSHQMIADGLEEEIRTIRSNYPDSKLLQTMNYKENCDIAKMVQSNMRYAHRQMSWWKRRVDIGWICV